MKPGQNHWFTRSLANENRVNKRVYIVSHFTLPSVLYCCLWNTSLSHRSCVVHYFNTESLIMKVSVPKGFRAPWLQAWRHGSRASELINFSGFEGSIIFALGTHVKTVRAPGSMAAKHSRLGAPGTLYPLWDPGKLCYRCLDWVFLSNRYIKNERKLKWWLVLRKTWTTLPKELFFFGHFRFHKIENKRRIYE